MTYLGRTPVEPRHLNCGEQDKVLSESEADNRLITDRHPVVPRLSNRHGISGRARDNGSHHTLNEIRLVGSNFHVEQGRQIIGNRATFITIAKCFSGF
jgi:hypothetical protein